MQGPSGVLERGGGEKEMVLRLHPTSTFLGLRRWFIGKRKKNVGAEPAIMAEPAGKALQETEPLSSLASGERVESLAAPESGVQEDVDLSAVPPPLRESVRCGVFRLAIKIGGMDFSKAEWHFLLSLLPPHEAKTVQRYYQEKDRKLALGSLLLQRRVASWVHSLPYNAVTIRRGDKNKPYVDGSGTRLPQWTYNVSHHGQYVVFASEPKLSVGVDLVDLNDRPFEKGLRSEDYLRHFQQHLTHSEWEMLMAIKDDESRYSAFFRIWSIKEAYVKALGLGLSFPISRIDCRLGSIHEDVGHEFLINGSESSSRWRLGFFRLDPSYLWCTIIGSCVQQTTHGSTNNNNHHHYDHHSSSNNRNGRVHPDDDATAGSLDPPHGSFVNTCRSEFQELKTMDDLIPDDRKGEWRKLMLMRLAAAGHVVYGGRMSPELATALS